MCMLRQFFTQKKVSVSKEFVTVFLRHLLILLSIVNNMKERSSFLKHLLFQAINYFSHSNAHRYVQSTCFSYSGTYNERKYVIIVMCILPGQQEGNFFHHKLLHCLKQKFKKMMGKKREWNGCLIERWESFYPSNHETISDSH